MRQEALIEWGKKIERERIRLNILDRVSDLRSCIKNDNCQELGTLIFSYIEEWLDTEQDDER